MITNNRFSDFKLVVMFRLRRFSLLFFNLFVFCLLSSDPIILDPKANNSFLKSLALELDKLGIDVMQDWKSKVKTSMKPILAPLANYPTRFSPEKEAWVKEFNNGIMGGITAIQSTEVIDESEFVNKWNSVDKEKRVFISFAREDLEQAKKVKVLLESKGYVAFIYLQGETAVPLQTAFQTGEFLGSAGTHVVLDTEIARKKSGVMAEALSYVSYIHPTTVNYHVVEIYGAKNRCNRTKQAIEYFKETGARVKYYDVDQSIAAAQVVERNKKYLELGELLPFIKVDGKPVLPKDYGVALNKCWIKGPIK